MVFLFLTRMTTFSETFHTAIWYIIYSAPLYEDDVKMVLGPSKDDADMCALTSEQKLQVMRVLIDAKLNHADVQQFITDVSERMPTGNFHEWEEENCGLELGTHGNAHHAVGGGRRRKQVLVLWRHVPLP